MSRFGQARATIEVTDEQIEAIHAQLCTNLVLKGRALRLGDKVRLKSPSGLIDEVIIRHVDQHDGFYVASIIPEDVIPFDSWHTIRVLRAENDSLIRQMAS